jgi:xanthine/uracil/vitamin C permease (AzgA family)
VVLVTSLLVLLASIGGLRGRVMQLFPSHLVFAMVVGLGLFLALVSARVCVLGWGHGRTPSVTPSSSFCLLALAHPLAPHHPCRSFTTHRPG